MFGCLRLLLAVAVLLSHLGLQIGGCNPGVISVIVFLMLSGFATRHLVTACGNDPVRYYTDRALRILPPYFVALALGVLCWLVLRPDSAFLSRTPGVADWLANITVLPLNLYRWTGQDHFTLVPQAWSLALELQFYAVAPFLVLGRRGPVMALAGASAVVWLLACWQVLDPDTWGYRLLPGTLFLFFAGFCIAGRDRVGAAAICGVVGAVAALLAAGVVHPVGFVTETVIGFALGGTVVPLLARRVPGRIDAVAGTLSYPLFLSHFAVLWAFDSAGLPPWTVLREPRLLVPFIAAALALSWGIHLVSERPLSAVRRRMRARTAGSHPQPALHGPIAKGDRASCRFAPPQPSSSMHSTDGISAGPASGG